MGDFKDDGSTDYFGHSTDIYGNPLYNYDGEPYTCIFEFIFDDELLADDIRQAGTFTKRDFFGGLNGHGGNIKSITFTGRKWSPEI